MLRKYLNIFLFAFALMIAINVGIASPAAAFEKIVVGVAKFSDQTKKGFGGLASESVSTVFRKLNYFEIVEFETVNSAMLEIAGQKKGIIPLEKAVEVGRKLGVDVLVLGNIKVIKVGDVVRVRPVLYQ